MLEAQAHDFVSALVWRRASEEWSYGDRDRWLDWLTLDIDLRTGVQNLGDADLVCKEFRRG